MGSAGEALQKESEIHGTTLRVYWYLFKTSAPVGVRETQRALSMSSPSIALYHLEKLRELGVTDKDEVGRYFLKEQVPVGSLKMFFKVGHVILPRFLFYAIFLTSAVVVYVVDRLVETGFVEPSAVIFGLAGAAVCWYECLRLWREKLL